MEVRMMVRMRKRMVRKRGMVRRRMVRKRRRRRTPATMPTPASPLARADASTQHQLLAVWLHKSVLGRTWLCSKASKRENAQPSTFHFGPPS